MTTARLRRLTLTDFRGYQRAELTLGGGSVFLFGPNGAGKTNLLEAISLLSPGRGLRGASIADLGRRAPEEAQGRIFEREKMGEARQAIGGDVTLAPSSLIRQAAEQ